MAQRAALAAHQRLSGRRERKQKTNRTPHCELNLLNTNNTMNFSADSDAKITLNINTGNLFSGNNTNFGGRGPQAKGLFQIGQPIPAQFQQGRKF